MKRESCSEASDSWTVHDFPCLLGSEKLVFNYRYKKYIVETSFCWRQGNHYALSILPKHLTGSTRRALLTPPSAPYPLHPQRLTHSTRSAPTHSTHSALSAPPSEPCLLQPQHPACSTRSTLPTPPAVPYRLHPQHPTPSISETAMFLCSLYK